MMDFIVILIVVANILCFLLYGADKLKAKTDSWRISEKTLLLWGAAAPFGAVAGMKVFRHKTRKAKFTVTLAVACILHILLYSTLINALIK